MKNNIKKAPLKFREDRLYFQRFMLIFVFTQIRDYHHLKWVKSFKNGKCCVEDNASLGRPKTSITKANSTAVKGVVDQYAHSWEKEKLVGLVYQKAVCIQL